MLTALPMQAVLYRSVSKLRQTAGPPMSFKKQAKLPALQPEKQEQALSEGTDSGLDDRSQQSQDETHFPGTSPSPNVHAQKPAPASDTQSHAR